MTIAVVTGMVAAKTAAGMLEASILETATTSSMTNNINVFVLSPAPSG